MAEWQNFRTAESKRKEVKEQEGEKQNQRGEGAVGAEIRKGAAETTAETGAETAETQQQKQQQQEECFFFSPRKGGDTS